MFASNLFQPLPPPCRGASGSFSEFLSKFKVLLSHRSILIDVAKVMVCCSTSATSNHCFGGGHTYVSFHCAIALSIVFLI